MGENKKCVNLEIAAAVLLRCFFIGCVALLLWWLLYLFLGDFIYSVHLKWFAMSRETFDVMHYAGMGLTKIAVFFFFLFPYIALKMVVRRMKQNG